MNRPALLGALVLAVVLALESMAATGLGPSTAAAQEAPTGDDPVRVGLVGDSIMLGAGPQLIEALTAAGFTPVVDAQESRSTSQGADHVRFLAASGMDAIVVMLGANDAGDPQTYRNRVKEVVAAADGVPRLYWMTIPETRDYYPAANQIVAEELAARPGGEVLDWNSVLADGLTSGDGMHLKPQGATAMAGFVALNLAEDLLGAGGPDASTTTGTQGELSAGSDPGAATDPDDPTSSEAPDPDPADAIQDDAGPDDAGRDDAVRDDAGQDDADTDPDLVETIAGPGGVLFAVVLVATVLGSVGVGIALWALWNSRRIHQS